MGSAKKIKEKLILFPTAIDHYQVQLIQYLEMERYADAYALLRYLDQFTVDEQTAKEWTVLKNWLVGTVGAEEGQTFIEDEWTEEQLLRQNVQNKLEREQNFTAKLMETLVQTSRMEKQLVSLEQLSVIENPAINESIKEWLENRQIHPLVQFKALQVLKTRGLKGTVKMYKGGEIVRCVVQDTPLQFNQFPIAVRRVLNRVIEASENTYASIGFFAEEMWTDYVSHIYATPLFQRLSKENDEHLNVWSSVLHHLVMESLHLTVDYKEMIAIYGVDPVTDGYWRKAYLQLKNFAH
jgi:hypothetical protein